MIEVGVEVAARIVLFEAGAEVFVEAALGMSEFSPSVGPSYVPPAWCEWNVGVPSDLNLPLAFKPKS